MQRVTRRKKSLKILKVKQPQLNRNKIKKNSQIQTIYESSEEDDRAKEIQRWNDQKLSITYKPQKLVGREKQKQQIQDFINGCLLKQISNRCLYISGCPGIGKTVTVMEIVNSIKNKLNKVKVQFQYINSLNLKNPNAIYKEILKKTKKTIQSKRDPYLLSFQLDKFLKQSQTQLFLIVDQVDFLYTKNQNILYNLVDWCTQATSFNIIMIANTIDFPQRLSPKITSRMGNWRMCFKPYSANEIKKIVQQRLNGSNLFESNAISFAVKKFSVYTSDLRKIFAVLKQVIQGKKEKKVKIEDFVKVWSKVVEEQNIEWKEQLPEIYNIVIDSIKRQGGTVHSLLLYRSLSQQKMSFLQIQGILSDMKQMGLVKLSRKTFQGCKGLMVTLLQI